MNAGRGRVARSSRRTANGQMARRTGSGCAVRAGVTDLELVGEQTLVRGDLSVLLEELALLVGERLQPGIIHTRQFRARRAERAPPHGSRAERGSRTLMSTFWRPGSMMGEKRWE